MGKEYKLEGSMWIIDGKVSEIISNFSVFSL